MGRVYDELEPNGVELASSSSTDATVPSDISKLRPQERHVFIEKLIKNIEKDNLQLLQKTRKRLDRVGVRLPTVEVRYRNLSVEAECDVIHGKPLPTLWNSLQSIVSYPAERVFGSKSHRAKMSIIKDISGIIKPGRMSLLLGPPGCGKTSLLKALSGNLNGALKVSGEVFYNGYKLEEFVPQKTSAYISQDDLHIPEMTVRETLDFSSRCQGLGNREELMKEVSRREKQAGIVPDPDIDTYMKATSMKGASGTLQTDYILKILGLDICAGTIVGDALRRGISGGQKKRLTTGEIIVGPIKTLFMDEITNGLDSSTAFQIIACLQQLLVIIAIVTMTAFLKSGMDIDILHANYYLGAIFYALLILVVDEFSEIHLTVSRLSIFYKQKMLYFYPAWAYAIPSIILKIPISFIQSLVWTSLTYYVMGYSPEVGRFFRQFLMYFTMQISSASLYRFLASICQTMDCSVAVGTLVLFLELIFCGFIIPQSFMPSWLRWAFWVSPITYATIGLAGNEFHAPRWQRVLAMNSTIGQETLEGHGFYFEEYFFWISIGILLGFALVWNLGYTLVLSFLKSPGSSRVVISHEKLSTVKKGDSLHGADMEDVSSFSHSHKKEESSEARMVLPFDPATLTFQNVQYYVDTPQEVRKEGYAQRKLQILSDISGAATPGVLTALMGPSGAGKTTLLDVLAGRKTIGYIEAGALTSVCYPLTNLFSGFLLPKLKIPSWWIWMYYLMPTSWTLNVLLTSQYGDVNDRIVVYTETTTVAALLDQYFGFGKHHIAVPAVLLFCYPLIFSSLFAFFINRLNFERR
ncbi:hypothetical protein V6N13_095372 [Hibiscus sabdariffa]